MSIFEIMMLISFGSAWPFSIFKSIKTKRNGSKSLFYLVIIFIGYICGIMHKVFYNYDSVIFLYILNTLMVLADIILFVRNSKYEK